MTRYRKRATDRKNGIYRTNRRTFLKLASGTAGALFLSTTVPYVSDRVIKSIQRDYEGLIPSAFANPASLNPDTIPRYDMSLLVPTPAYGIPLMNTQAAAGTYNGDPLLCISAFQFQQQVLPPTLGLPLTTVWGYGPANPNTGALVPGGIANFPALTIQAETNERFHVKWLNSITTGTPPGSNAAHTNDSPHKQCRPLKF